MPMNWLKVNDDMTGFIIFGIPSQLSKVTAASIRVGEHTIEAETSVRQHWSYFT